MKQVLQDIQKCIDELAAPTATSVSGGAGDEALSEAAGELLVVLQRLGLPDNAPTNSHARAHIKATLQAVAAPPAASSLVVGSGGEAANSGVPDSLLSAYCDLAASHDDALPLTATADEDGRIQLHMRNGWPVEAQQDFADFVAAACNAAGAGFVADMHAFAKEASAAPLLSSKGAGADGWVSVGERLPERSLTHPRTGHRVSAPMLVAQGKKVLTESHYMRDDNEWLAGPFATHGITHWQPLPAAPQS